MTDSQPSRAQELIECFTRTIDELDARGIEGAPELDTSTDVSGLEAQFVALRKVADMLGRVAINDRIKDPMTNELREISSITYDEITFHDGGSMGVNEITEDMLILLPSDTLDTIAR